MANNIQNVNEAIGIAQQLQYNRYEELHDWMTTASVRDIHAFIVRLKPYDRRDFLALAQTALQVRLAEEAAKTADKMAEQTNSLVQHTEKLTQQTGKLISESVNLSKLTKVLIWLTVALWAAAVIQIVIMVFDYIKHK